MNNIAPALDERRYEGWNGSSWHYNTKVRQHFLNEAGNCLLNELGVEIE